MTLQLKLLETVTDAIHSDFLLMFFIINEKLLFNHNLRKLL